MGMRGLLARSPRVTIMMEVSPRMLSRRGLGPAAVVGSLGELGFNFWEMGSEGKLIEVMAEDLAQLIDGSIRNLLAAREPI